MSDRRLRLAYFSPLPPEHSGIADYSRALVPQLARLADVTLYADRPEAVEAGWGGPFDIRRINAYPAERWGYDLAIYQMGNSSYHRAMYGMLLRYPGVTVLHDYGLHHFVSEVTAGQGDYAGYVREMGYALGAAGAEQAWEIYFGRRSHSLFELPLNERVLDRSLGLIIHSQFIEGKIRVQRPGIKRLRVIPALMERQPKAVKPAELNLPAGSLVFASAGLVTAAKQPEMALRAFGRLRQEMPQAHFLVIGEVHPEVDLAGLVERLGLAGAVTCTGFVASLEEFVGWLLAADVVVNLREPTVGETSATALRALAAGRPVIVFDHGWYSELPDEVSCKVRPLDEAGLVEAMGQLASSAERRQAMGRAAVDYIKANHDPAVVAGEYVDFLGELVAGYGFVEEGNSGELGGTLGTQEENKATRGQGDKETRGQGDRGKRDG